MEMHELLQKEPEIWDLFTRKEEYGSSLRDQYERFSYYSSSDRNILEPRVSKYLIQHGYHAEYPEGKSFALCLTHDIDVLYKNKRRKTLEALDHLFYGRFSAGIHSITQMHSKKVPWWNFSDIMALEDQYNAKSSFYFMVEDPGDPEFNYAIEDCGSVIAEISKRGWEVGLHGGHTTYKDPVEMRRKKQRLEKVLKKSVVGYRNHYLRFSVPETWEYVHEAGFQYDTTFGYSDSIGFRNGMCHPFRPFNLKTGKTIEILEIPLIIMDGSLFDSYMRLDCNRAWEITRRLIDTVAEYHGVITLLWHNTFLADDKRKFYEKILNYCNEKNAWMTSGEHIASWWKQNVKV
jgi:peptidoglycan/xylan/chitin deacetylase (PgdA/CDA1 family)